MYAFKLEENVLISLLRKIPVFCRVRDVSIDQNMVVVSGSGWTVDTCHDPRCYALKVFPLDPGDIRDSVLVLAKKVSP